MRGFHGVVFQASRQDVCGGIELRGATEWMNPESGVVSVADRAPPHGPAAGPPSGPSPGRVCAPATRFSSSGAPRRVPAAIALKERTALRATGARRPIPMTRRRRGAAGSRRRGRRYGLWLHMRSQGSLWRRRGVRRNHHQDRSEGSLRTRSKHLSGRHQGVRRRNGGRPPHPP